MKKLIKNKKGMTLLEIIVATGMFALAILTSTQILQMAMTGQRNAMASQNVEENLRYVFEVISKELRYAQVSTPGECGNASAEDKLYYENGGILYFKNSKDECVEYSLSGNKEFQIDRGGTTLPITPASDVEVSDLAFDIVHYADNSQQARVTVKMKVRAINVKEMHKSQMIVQTTITPRYYKN